MEPSESPQSATSQSPENVSTGPQHDSGAQPARERLTHTMECCYCPAVFAALRRDARFCSDACRAAASRARRGTVKRHRGSARLTPAQMTWGALKSRGGS